MRFINCRYLSAILLLAGLIGCNQQPSPQEIREKTAQATKEATRDAKAVAQGIRDGLHNEHSVDLNSASKDDLTSLPGMTSEEADRVIANRPYNEPDELVTKHVVPRAEYDKIADRVTAKR